LSDLHPHHRGGSASELDPRLTTVCDTIAPAFAGGTGASRNNLLWTAMNAWAPATTIALLMRLPDPYYVSLDEVRSTLAETLSA
jgi:hypothetical protein